MTKFVRESFSNHAGWVTYNNEFVARFKYGAKPGAATFITFLIKNFTVEEYFGEIAKGVSPLKIVEAKGYLLPHIKRWLKAGGYSVDRAGYEQFSADNFARVLKNVEARKAA